MACRGRLTFANLHSGCLHTPSHLTGNVLRDDLNDGTDNSTVAIWTGHILNNNGASTSNSSRHSIVLTPKYTTDETNEYSNKSPQEVAFQSIYTLMHECSHQLGAPDHYCAGVGASGVCSNKSCDVCYKSGYNSPRRCIMSYRYDISTLDDNEIYCYD